MQKLKVMTVLGTRPEIIRLSRVIEKLDAYCDHVLVHTGQNYDYELNQVFFDDLSLRKPDYFLEAAGQTGAETIGNVISKTDKVLVEVNPDAFLVLGDTNSCMAAISAKRRKVPIFHMEAGNRCFDMRVPEEINRRIVDHTADINLTYSSIAREYLLGEGLKPDFVIKTGSPMKEVLAHHREKIEASRILEQLELHSGGYFLVSAHREENIDPEPSVRKLVAALNAVASTFGLAIIVSTHPRTMKRLDAIGATFDPLIKLLKPMGFLDYVALQTQAKAVLSDSGTINEESSILNFPALNLREAHERPEGMEETAVMMVGLEIDRILQGLSILDHQPRGADRSLRIVADYDIDNVSEKVVRIIHSYTDYVNLNVWKKVKAD